MVSTGTLSVSAHLIDDQLRAYPVVGHTLRVIRRSRGADTGIVHTLEIGPDGSGSLELTVAAYRIESERPIRWRGLDLSWDKVVVVRPAETTKVDLSNDEFVMEKLAAGELQQEAAIFRRLRSSVFLIQSERGHGTGFLVDPRGLVLTNHHVAGKDPAWLAVKISRARKYRAVVVSTNEAADIAVLRVHPDTVRGLTALPLAAPCEDADCAGPAHGDVIFGIGPPFDEDAQLRPGAIHSLEGPIIFTSADVRPGDSGGPLLNLRGEVIGIHSIRLVSATGVGAAGAIRIEEAVAALKEARRRLVSEEPPPATGLPVAPEEPYTESALASASGDSTRRVDQYDREAGKFDLTFFTPPLMKSIQIEEATRKKKHSKGHRGRSSGRPHDEFSLLDTLPSRGARSETTSALVTVLAYPEVGGGAKRGFGIFFGVLSAALTGIGYIPGYRPTFKSSFVDMTLMRGEEEIPPVHPGRMCDMKIYFVDGNVKEIACYGAYAYDAEAFRPGASMTLRIRGKHAPGEPDDVRIPGSLVTRIWEDFEPYRRSVPPAEFSPAATEPIPPP